MNDDNKYTTPISIKVTAVPCGEIPPEQGDYAKTIFFNSFGKNKPIKYVSDYSAYYTYELGIKDPNKYHKDLIRDGYLIEDAISGSLSTLKIDDLKEIAKENNIILKGKKADMINTLITMCNEDSLKSIAPTTYSLSVKGEHFFKDHYDYVELHRHKTWGIGWEEYDKQKNLSQTSSFYEIVKAIFRRKASDDQRFFGRIHYLRLSELEDQYGSPEMSLNYLLQVLYIDLSGVMGLDSYDYYRRGYYDKESVIGMYSSNIFIASAIIDRIKKKINYYNPSVVEKLYSWKLPIQLCDKELFHQIIQSIVDNTYDYETYNYILKKKYYSYIDSIK